MHHSGLRLETETIDFTHSELRRMKEIANYRNFTHEMLKVRTLKLKSTTSDFATHYIGTFGEYAVAKYLNLPLPKEKFCHYGDEGWDAILSNGWTVEVKTRTRQGWDFAFYKGKIKQFKADIGILVWMVKERNQPIATVRQAEIVGWITRGHFKEICEVYDYGYGNSLRVRPEQLFSIQALYTINGPR